MNLSWDHLRAKITITNMKIEHVAKNYKQHPIFENASLSLKEGSFSFVTGDSGVGKSTLLHMLMGDIMPDAWKIINNENMDLSKMNRREKKTYRKQCGFVYQDYQLIPYKNVAENIVFWMEVTCFPKRQIEKRKNELLSQMKLTHKAKHYPHELSWGEQQRVAIARAIVHQPKYIFADEPTGNLDIQSSLEILSILQDLHVNGSTIIFATHDQSILSKSKADVYRIEDLQIKKI